jgi:hypothetical protein
LKNAGAFPDLRCTMEVFASVKACLDLLVALIGCIFTVLSYQR